MHNTSHVTDEPYPTLLQDKGFRAFPSICFMDTEGNVLTRPGRSVKAMAETQAQTSQLVALRAKGDKASATQQRDLFLVELQLDLVKADEIQARADKLTLSEADKKFVAQKLVDAEIGAIMAKAQKEGPEKTGEALAGILAAGKTPSDQISSQFWFAVLNHAAKQKDAKLAQRCYDVLEKRHSGDKQFERALPEWKKLLDEAKAK